MTNNFKCIICKLPTYFLTMPKENCLYQCDNCLSYFLFKDMVDKGDYFEFTIKRVKFKTREMEREWLVKNKIR